jgi:ubiquinone/menaquinone biosynthesis C-methylase UbiE
MKKVDVGIAKPGSRYKFETKPKLISGVKHNFFELVKKYSDKDYVALDLGCGSGELTLSLAPYFKKIIGVDHYETYIQTAEKDRVKKNIKNVEFKIAGADSLPFEESSFDIVYSSRGPLSADSNFIEESSRVLKQDGLFIEETIGEKDLIELKEIFRRGQNYPIKIKRQDKIKSLLDGNFQILDYKDPIYSLLYNKKDFMKLLERAPIIPNFDRDKDKKFIQEYISTFKMGGGIKLNRHFVHWVAKKLK